MQIGYVYCWVTRDHKRSGLTQHTMVTSASVGWESGHAPAGSSALGLTWLSGPHLVTVQVLGGTVVSVEAGMGSGLPPGALRLLAEFISLWL